MIFSFSRLLSTCGALFLAGFLLAGCAQEGGQRVWNPSSWFGNVGQNDHITQSPDISHIKGPLTPPDAAPHEQVQRSPLPPAVISTSPAVSPQVAPPVITSGAPMPPVIEPVIPVKIKVGILLPLTGKNEKLGHAMLNAAQQAVFDAADDKFELMPHDTGEGEATAEKAARDAIQDGAQLLIGPMFATKVPAVRAIAAASQVNILTLSTDTSLAGQGVYVMGFAPGAQVERIIKYASSHGLRRFAALLPDNAYGKLSGDVFKRTVAENGGAVIAIEMYDPAKRDSAAHVKSLALHRDKIDALFLPEGGPELVQIASQLNVAGFDNNRIRLLGTGLWDVDNLGQQSPFLISGWYAASDPAGRRSFAETYKAAYGQEPPRLATLAYDATALAAVLEKRGARFDAQDLTNPNGFAGLDGIFRLTPQGTAERGLAVNQVGPDGIHVIDAAPTTFAVK